MPKLKQGKGCTDFHPSAQCLLMETSRGIPFCGQKKAAILPAIAYFLCGPTAVWSLKCWMSFDSPYPIISAKS